MLPDKSPFVYYKYTANGVERIDGSVIGETRWTLAHEHAWFSSPDYRTFLLVMLGVVLTWAFGITFAHQLCG